MRIESLGKISPVAVPGAIFASAIKDTFIELSNYRQVTFLIESGEGTAANITITVEAKEGADGTASEIPFLYMISDEEGFTEEESATFSIGGAAGKSKVAVVTVTAPMLAKGGYDRVAIKTTAATNSTVPGAIYAIASQTRYSE